VWRIVSVVGEPGGPADKGIVYRRAKWVRIRSAGSGFFNWRCYQGKHGPLAQLDRSKGISTPGVAGSNPCWIANQAAPRQQLLFRASARDQDELVELGRFAGRADFGDPLLFVTARGGGGLFDQLPDIVAEHAMRSIQL